MQHYDDDMNVEAAAPGADAGAADDHDNGAIIAIMAQRASITHTRRGCRFRFIFQHT